MSEKGDDHIHDAMNTHNEAEATHAFNSWIGAVLIYLLHLDRKPFTEVYTKEHSFRNGLIGWLVTLIVVLGVMGLIVYL